MTKIDKQKRFRRTKRGLLYKIYGGQVTSSKTRGHSSPKYSFEDLYNWAMSQHLFHDLYDLWVISGFDKMQTPSIDRLKDNIGYKFSNIQLSTWQENFDKSLLNRGKIVLQLLKNGKVINEFKSAKEASNFTGVNYSGISKVCSGKRLFAGGFGWTFK